MQAVKLIIPGRYWDSQIYMGRLYLFDLEGDLRTVNWDLLPEKMGISENLRYPFYAAFIDGSELYSGRLSRLLTDSSMRHLLTNKFERLTESEIAVSGSMLDSLTISRQQSPFPFPHSDTLIYFKNFYSVGRSGVFRAQLARQRKRYRTTISAEKLWDCPVIDGSASYMHIALAAGNEGLFEIPARSYYDTSNFNEPHSVSSYYCAGCDWTYFSIYCSSFSDLGPAYMAAYTKPQPREARTIGIEEDRKLERIVGVNEIFGNYGYSWGTKDKIYLVDEHSIKVVRYNPWKKRDILQSFETLESITLEAWKGEIVSAGVGAFGLVLECENAIVVVPSQGDPITIPGEPISWRIFPRSVNYENQLHIIFDDRMEILSFNQDYFVDQTTKRAGYMYSAHDRPTARLSRWS